jgi:hypothetical protein
MSDISVGRRAAVIGEFPSQKRRMRNRSGDLEPACLEEDLRHGDHVPLRDPVGSARPLSGQSSDGSASAAPVSSSPECVFEALQNAAQGDSCRARHSGVDPSHRRRRSVPGLLQLVLQRRTHVPHERGRGREASSACRSWVERYPRATDGPHEHRTMPELA